MTGASPNHKSNVHNSSLGTRGRTGVRRPRALSLSPLPPAQPAPSLPFQPCRSEGHGVSVALPPKKRTHTSMKRRFFRLLFLGPCLLLNACSSLNPDAAFESSDSRWGDREILFKGRDFGDMLVYFNQYKFRSDKPTVSLVRITPINRWNLFAAGSYRTNPKWRVPYAAPSSYYASYSYPAKAPPRPSTNAEFEIFRQRADADYRHYKSLVGTTPLPKK